MIKKHSDDPDVAQAAALALVQVKQVLVNLPQAESYDYGGHVLRIGDYGVCTVCTKAIAEAQLAERALRAEAERTEDETVREHIDLAAHYFNLEAQVAIVRAELHNGRASEGILNCLLGHVHDRSIHDSFEHTHHGGTL